MWIYFHVSYMYAIPHMYCSGDWANNLTTPLHSVNAQDNDSKDWEGQCA
jgi:hypothetical protein